eukprot:6182495-Pleurochrysis_carterae.AAC.1
MQGRVHALSAHALLAPAMMRARAMGTSYARASCMWAACVCTASRACAASRACTACACHARAPAQGVRVARLACAMGSRLVRAREGVALCAMHARASRGCASCTSSAQSMQAACATCLYVRMQATACLRTICLSTMRAREMGSSLSCHTLFCTANGATAFVQNNEGHAHGTMIDLHLLGIKQGRMMWSKLQHDHTKDSMVEMAELERFANGSKGLGSMLAVDTRRLDHSSQRGRAGWDATVLNARFRPHRPQGWQRGAARVACAAWEAAA